MAWMDAKEAAAKWVGEKLAADMHGHVVQLVKFESEAEARFFNAEIGQTWQQMLNTAIARAARKRGAGVVHTTVNRQHYHTWRSGQGRQDTDKARIEFIASMQRVDLDE